MKVGGSNYTLFLLKEKGITKKKTVSKPVGSIFENPPGSVKINYRFGLPRRDSILRGFLFDKKPGRFYEKYKNLINPLIEITRI